MPLSGAPQKRKPNRRHQPCKGMKQPIPEHVVLHGDEICRRHDAREHIVPLQDLMKQDAIKEAPEPYPKQSARRDQRASMLSLSHTLVSFFTALLFVESSLEPIWYSSALITASTKSGNEMSAKLTQKRTSKTEARTKRAVAQLGHASASPAKEAATRTNTEQRRRRKVTHF